MDPFFIFFLCSTHPHPWLLCPIAIHPSLNGCKYCCTAAPNRDRLTYLHLPPGTLDRSMYWTLTNDSGWQSSLRPFKTPPLCQRADSVYSNNFHYSVNKLESASSHFYATQSHAIGGYATAGRLPVGSLTGARPRGPSPLPPQMQGQVPRPPMPKPPMMQPQPQRPAPQPAPTQAPPKVAFPPQQQQQGPAPAPSAGPGLPAPTSAFRPAPNTVPRAGIPPKVHNE
uniref:Uncharacterized protein n=1 Tax=Anopheles culicifacies TaxID=139723 RepID=A0A182LW42_9DIPT